MLWGLLNVALGALKLDLKRVVRDMSVTAALALAALVVLLVAAGFGLALLYVWLQMQLGTLDALAIIAGGCAVIGLILLALAIWRPRGKQGAARRAAAPPPPREEATAGAAGAAAGAQGTRVIEEAIAAMKEGSRETMLAAVAMAVVAGVVLGRKI
jgi:hypothetical protein